MRGRSNANASAATRLFLASRNDGQTSYIGLSTTWTQKLVKAPPKNQRGLLRYASVYVCIIEACAFVCIEAVHTCDWLRSDRPCDLAFRILRIRIEFISKQSV